MSMTIVEKILARASGKGSVSPNDLIWVDADVLMTHDVCGPPTIDIFKREFGDDAKVFNKDKVVIIPDHYIFTKDTHALRNQQILRDFSEEQDITYFYDKSRNNYSGVCHVTLAEEGHNIPGTVMFGTDSHTCTSGAFGLFSTGIGNTDAAFIMGTGKIWLKVPPTIKFIIDGELPPYVQAKDIILKILGDIGVDGATYKTMEFCGEAISGLSMDERMTLCNMAIEGGAKNGIIGVDKTTEDFLESRTKKSYEKFESDSDAKYEKVIRYEAKEIEPTIAKPHSPDNSATVKSLVGTKLDISYIGSCTGGKIEDFITAAKIIGKNKVKITTYIIPSTTCVEKELHTLKQDGRSLYSIFEEAGCIMGPPSCAACLGGPVDTLGRTKSNEKVIATTNRNFPGRMGSKSSEVFLSSPITAAAAAISGKITDPRDFF